LSAANNKSMDFFQQYFVDPILYGTGYNIVNTLTYAIILIIAVFVILWVLKRLEIRLDRRLWYSLVPFVVLGGVLRALEDINFFDFLGAWHYVFVTPLIYVLVFAIAFACILLTKYTKRNITLYVGIGLVSVFGAVALVKAQRWDALGIVAGIAITSFLVVYLAFRQLRSKFLTGENSHVLAGHILDASASFTAVSVIGGYFEQHVVPSTLFSALPFWLFIPLKIFIVLFALYIIARETEGDWRWMLTFALLVLGLGPGTRDILTLLIAG
jgi:uncharacterized membrane protein